MFIIICYCNIKIKNYKRPIKKVEYRHPGKMMLLHGISDNILIPNLSYLVVYQDEETNKSSTKR